MSKTDMSKADMSNKEKENLNIQLRSICTEGNVELLSRLIEEGVHIDHQFHDNSTLLANAVKNKRNDLMCFLLKLGANVNKCSFAGRSPLTCAVENGSYETVECLLNHGALISKEFIRGKEYSVMNIARRYGYNDILTLLEKHYKLQTEASRRGMGILVSTEDTDIDEHICNQ